MPSGVAWGAGRFEDRDSLDQRLQMVRAFLAQNARQPESGETLSI